MPYCFASCAHHAQSGEVFEHHPTSSDVSVGQCDVPSTRDAQEYNAYPRLQDPVLYVPSSKVHNSSRVKSRTGVTSAFVPYRKFARKVRQYIPAVNNSNRVPRVSGSVSASARPFRRLILTPTPQPSTATEQLPEQQLSPVIT